MRDEFYGIKILKDGTWLYNGSPILRMNLVRLFASVLKRDDAGDYWLVTPYEKGRIEVEDAPFVAVELRAKNSGKDQILEFRTNLDDWVEAGKIHPLRVEIAPHSQEPAPYVRIRDNLEARLTRAVYYDLVALAVEDEAQPGRFGVWSGGTFFPVGRSQETAGRKNSC
jgi:hypothetical protein